MASIQTGYLHQEAKTVGLCSQNKMCLRKTWNLASEICWAELLSFLTVFLAFFKSVPNDPIHRESPSKAQTGFCPEVSVKGWMSPCSYIPSPKLQWQTIRKPSGELGDHNLIQVKPSSCITKWIHKQPLLSATNEKTIDCHHELVMDSTLYGLTQYQMAQSHLQHGTS